MFIFSFIEMNQWCEMVLLNEDVAINKTESVDVQSWIILLIFSTSHNVSPVRPSCLTVEIILDRMIKAYLIRCSLVVLVMIQQIFGIYQMNTSLISCKTSNRV